MHMQLGDVVWINRFRSLNFILRDNFHLFQYLTQSEQQNYMIHQVVMAQEIFQCGAITMSIKCQKGNNSETEVLGSCQRFAKEKEHLFLLHQGGGVADCPLKNSWIQSWIHPRLATKGRS